MLPKPAEEKKEELVPVPDTKPETEAQPAVKPQANQKPQPGKKPAAKSKAGPVSTKPAKPAAKAEPEKKPDIVEKTTPVQTPKEETKPASKAPEKAAPLKKPVAKSKVPAGDKKEEPAKPEEKPKAALDKKPEPKPDEPVKAEVKAVPVKPVDSEKDKQPEKTAEKTIEKPLSEPTEPLKVNEEKKDNDPVQKKKRKKKKVKPGDKKAEPEPEPKPAEVVQPKAEPEKPKTPVSKEPTRSILKTPELERRKSSLKGTDQPTSASRENTHVSFKTVDPTHDEINKVLEANKAKSYHTLKTPVQQNFDNLDSSDDELPPHIKLLASQRPEPKKTAFSIFDVFNLKTHIPKRKGPPPPATPDIDEDNISLDSVPTNSRAATPIYPRVPTPRKCTPLSFVKSGTHVTVIYLVDVFLVKLHPAPSCKF